MWYKFDDLTFTTAIFVFTCTASNFFLPYCLWNLSTMVINGSKISGHNKQKGGFINGSLPLGATINQCKRL